MIWTLFVIVLLLWMLGMQSAVTLGGFVHLLPAVALAIAALGASPSQTA